VYFLKNLEGIEHRRIKDIDHTSMLELADLYLLTHKNDSAYYYCRKVIELAKVRLMPNEIIRSELKMGYYYFKNRTNQFG